ncbi:F-box protein At4g35930 [Sesamum indicum]|uniref:F-box protein At4g35930 n=1 Tax=Sesamum indicum TaxID=4182 RepID=A0A6I9UF10_SESIN|nr:F-box protein At4g35930 [Sesamum indicum]XP_020554634.1 F-box protein At4g35930 [Sesamum indicum]
MGKVSPNGRQPKTGRQKKQSRNAKNKYLKPGALAQLRNSKASASKPCTDLGKKRVAVLNAKQSGGDNPEIHLNQNTDKSPTLLSPVRFQFAPVIGSPDVFSQNNLQSTPKTPRAEECESESRLESLPIDLLVKILCHLHHDQLRAVFHVSQKIRKAVIIARQFHFNYTTPDRTRQEMLNTMTPLPTDHWPFVSKGGGKGMWITSPHAPKAPKHGPRPPSRLKFTEMRQIAAVLFQESSFSSKCLVPSVLQKPICKSLASNRVLFYEDELCQAVAQNKLR